MALTAYLRAKVGDTLLDADYGWDHVHPEDGTEHCDAVGGA